MMKIYFQIRKKEIEPRRTQRHKEFLGEEKKEREKIDMKSIHHKYLFSDQFTKNAAICIFLSLLLKNFVSFVPFVVKSS